MSVQVDVAVSTVAERIVRRVVASALRLAHCRFDLEEADVDEEHLVDDILAVALGEDTGCLAPEDLDEDNCELLFVEAELGRLVKAVQ